MKRISSGFQTPELGRKRHRQVSFNQLQLMFGDWQFPVFRRNQFNIVEKKQSQTNRHQVKSFIYNELLHWLYVVHTTRQFLNTRYVILNGCSRANAPYLCT